MIRRPPRSTLDRSSAASDVYKRQPFAIMVAHSRRREVPPAPFHVIRTKTLTARLWVARFGLTDRTDRLPFSRRCRRIRGAGGGGYAPMSISSTKPGRTPPAVEGVVR